MNRARANQQEYLISTLFKGDFPPLHIHMFHRGHSDQGKELPDPSGTGVAAALRRAGGVPTWSKRRTRNIGQLDPDRVEGGWRNRGHLPEQHGPIQPDQVNPAPRYPGAVPAVGGHVHREHLDPTRSRDDLSVDTPS